MLKKEILCFSFFYLPSLSGQEKTVFFTPPPPLLPQLPPALPCVQSSPSSRPTLGPKKGKGREGKGSTSQKLHSSLKYDTLLAFFPPGASRDAKKRIHREKNLTVYLVVQDGLEDPFVCREWGRRKTNSDEASSVSNGATLVHNEEGGQHTTTTTLFEVSSERRKEAPPCLWNKRGQTAGKDGWVGWWNGRLDEKKILFFFAHKKCAIPLPWRKERG